MDDLGRLIRTLHEKCPVCHSPLQMRAVTVKLLVKGQEITEEEIHCVCSLCSYEEDVEPKRRKSREIRVDARKLEGRRNGDHKKRERTS